MENQTVLTVKSNAEPEEISDSFLCCICLDLLYKPIVLSCGHISCFWCVHRSMEGLRESQCPICRSPYIHFPSICVMLHRLLLKMYPIAYKMREIQILEDERRCDFFSPQLDNHACEPLVDNECHHRNDSMQFSRMFCGSSTKAGSHENMEQLESVSVAMDNGTSKQSSIEGMMVVGKKLPPNELNGKCKHISIADVLCTACKQLLIHPVVLNCGHVYCKTCIITPTVQQLKCEVCQCPNPNGFPKVCLGLDQFLEEQFSKEYALRSDAVQFKNVQLNHESATMRSMGAGKSGFISSSGATGEHYSSWLADPHSEVHVGVGCDSCGISLCIAQRFSCLVDHVHCPLTAFICLILRNICSYLQFYALDPAFFIWAGALRSPCSILCSPSQWRLSFFTWITVLHNFSDKDPLLVFFIFSLPILV